MQTVSWAGSTYNIPNQRGDTPWSGLSDFAVAVAAKGLNTGGGNFTLLADVNFGANFGIVSAYFKSRTANISTAGILRLANADTIGFRNAANSANLLLGLSTNTLQFNGANLLTAGGGLIVNADISASAAIDYSKLAALTVSRALRSSAAGVVEVSTVTSTELGYLSGVTSAIQTQINSKGSGTVTSVSGTANQITSTGGATPVLALAAPLTLPGAMTAGGVLAMASNKITGLAAGTANGDAVRFEQLAGLKFGQIVMGTSSTQFATTNASFQNTNLSVSITPTLNTSSVLVLVFGGELQGTAIVDAYATISRGTSNLGGTNGMAVIGATTAYVPVSMGYLDAPATTSATTYRAQLRSSSGGTSVNFGFANLTQVILAIEIYA